MWFDSGSSHLAVVTPENNLPWPADMYLEGGDQYRGWFQSSLLIGVGLRGASPFRECVTSGWTLDEQGRAMSKSIGNTIEPEKIIGKYGAEVLRLWVASVEYNEDVRLSNTILERLAEAYRKLRNTFRYALGNLHKFDPAQHQVPAAEMQEIDQWILVRTEELVRKCRGMVRRVCVPQGVSRGVRFRDYRSEFHLLRRAERPAVHLRAERARRGVARRRRSTGSTTRWCDCWRRCCRSPPTKSGRYMARPADSPAERASGRISAAPRN